MKTRIISAIVMIALFIPLLIIGEIPYLVMTTILAVMGMWELMRLEKMRVLCNNTLKANSELWN